MVTTNNDLNLNMKRPPLYNDAFPIILFWSQKSGCTSLAKWFFFQINLLEEALKYNSFIHVYKDKVYQNQNNLIRLKNALLVREKATLKLVRNPYTRAVSSFLHVLNYHTPLGTSFREQLELLYSQNKSQGMSFKQFLYAIKKVGTDIDSIDGHVAQQYVNGEEQWVQQYIQLENFNTEIQNLEKNYNLLKSPLEVIIQSNHHQSISQNDNGLESYSEKIMTREILLRGNLPKYSQFYDQETLELCRELYMKDFQTYHIPK